MFPILFKFGPINIYSYGFMFMLAVAISILLASKKAKRDGLEPQKALDLCFWIIVSGIIGARLVYIILNLRYFIYEPKEILMLQHGGLVLYGGLGMGILGAIFYLKKNKLDILNYADLLCPFVALAQAIGRIGCFLNGCCFGRECSIGIYSSVHEAILIPAQLVSSLLLLIIFVILRFLQDHPHKKGTIFLSYLSLYSTKRFFVEFLRGDSLRILFGLTGFQITSLVIFVISFILLVKIRLKK